MMKKIFLYTLILSFLNYIGCLSPSLIDKETFFSERYEEPISEITIITNRDNKIKIDEFTYKIADDTLYAKGFNRTNIKGYNNTIDIKIALVDIKYVEIDKRNHLITLGIFIGITILMFGLLVAIIGFPGTTDKSPQGSENRQSNNEN